MSRLEELHLCKSSHLKSHSFCPLPLNCDSWSEDSNHAINCDSSRDTSSFFSVTISLVFYIKLSMDKQLMVEEISFGNLMTVFFELEFTWSEKSDELQLFLTVFLYSTSKLFIATELLSYCFLNLFFCWTIRFKIYCF